MAALTQFPDTAVEVMIRNEISEESQIKEAILDAVHLNGFIVHTVVSKKLRNAIGKLGRLHNIRTIDIMGPLLAQLANHFSDLPSEKPGLYHKLNREYFRRIEATEFAFRHDDGQRTHELKKADLILLGVSRTFKTPLCIYFAYKGWLAANVPIINNLPIPKEVYDLPSRKVFCLTTNALNLSTLRSVRHMHLGGATGDYATIQYVRKEIEFANRIFNKQAEWTVINVANKPIEEIASEILDNLKL